MRKLKQELKSAFPDRHTVPDNVVCIALKHQTSFERVVRKTSGLLISADRLVQQTCSNLPYLQAVINETLRRYPTIVATLPRTAAEDVVVVGEHLPKGVCASASACRRSLWLT